jgi:hypothetical protein
VKNLVTLHSSAPVIAPRLELSLASASKDLEACREDVSPTVAGGFCPPPSACPSQVPAFRDSSAQTGELFTAAAACYTMLLA